MERESFEDEAVAEILNREFVCIKVDREERPDIDQVYMSVCQAMTGQGGWPLTIVMDSAQRPFFAGTYFPKVSAYGRAGLLELLPRLAQVFRSEPDNVERVASQISAALKRAEQEEKPARGAVPDRSLLESAVLIYKKNFDERYGGFSDAPKFPSPHNMVFLLNHAALTGDEDARKMALHTLRAMAYGGIWDVVGYGFSRYSTDRAWLVPHFEKMLYDNALLLQAYTLAFQMTRDPFYQSIAEKIVIYVLRDLGAPDGGFYCAEDADSEGEEGKFYVWRAAELREWLDAKDVDEFMKAFGASEAGNFEGANILHTPHSFWDEPMEEREKRFSSSLTRLFEIREKRVRPHRDDKILTSWNALMIGALAYAGRVFKRDDFIARAQRASDWIETHMVREDGRLLARYRDGEARYLAYQEDYAYLAWAKLQLYDATYDPDHMARAVAWTDEMVRLFWDDQRSGFFFYGSDGESLLARPKEVYDGALPSGNSVAAYVLARLRAMLGQERHREWCDRQIAAFYRDVKAHPVGYAQFLQALQWLLYPTSEVVIAIPEKTQDASPFLVALTDHVHPLRSVLVVSEQTRSLIQSLAPYTIDHVPREGKVTAYVCESFACKAPVTNVNDFVRQLSMSES
ncbi:hypothetical protein ATW55_09205 [Ferroacidibacillus organovorans]|uniref:Spermatogenesis-associated protein 20-like TRX domain-containing protein n=1 Tax=Ferroacidibacillus organovorans TaxID=1765683 RepID=A0A101XQX4_9BACL|nr:hypothetical protein ATW55_09205 [Ferroacidibacillus organovorans]